MIHEAYDVSPIPSNRPRVLCNHYGALSSLGGLEVMEGLEEHGDRGWRSRAAGRENWMGNYKTGRVRADRCWKWYLD